MKNRIFTYSLLAAVGAMAFGAYTAAQPAKNAPQPAHQPANHGEAGEVEIKFSDAPEAVRKAALKLTTEANITKVTRETAHGVNLYEVEFKDGATSSSADFAESGDVLEVERGIAEADIPAAAMTAIHKAHPGATLGQPHLVTKTFYEIEIVENGKKHEVKVNAAGMIEGRKHDGDAKGEREEDEDDEKEEMNKGKK